ncbi:MAG: PQQ-binding-like beta-propeller repeat protein [Planctomycetia bacterium]|nr:PQQ-binding-like beta-propeller repeat protein [Planctomycetia bacterium]
MARVAVFNVKWAVPTSLVIAGALLVLAENNRARTQEKVGGAGGAHPTDWPHWRGPNRNDLVDEQSGWKGKEWLEGNPLWTAHVGAGSTSPIVVESRVYVLGNDGQSDNLFCLDAATGKQIWKTSYRCRRYGRNANGDEGLYSGPTSTSEYDDESGLLYTLSCDGDLAAWDTRDQGRKAWGINLYDRYRMPPRPRVGRSGQRDYGYTASPLVHGSWLIVEVGSPEGNLMAFDKRTGERVWTSQSRDLAGHTGGLVPMTVEGVPCAAVLTFSHLLVARLDAGSEGRTVAEYPWITEFANSIATPAVHEQFVVVTSGYNHDSVCKLEITLRGARKVWERERASSKTCSPVIHKGRVYWAFGRLQCLDFESGKTVWEGPRVGDAGSCIVTADDRLIVWADRGDLFLAETAQRSPEKYEELWRRRGLAENDVWPHVVLADGKLFCKDRDGRLACLRIAGK